MVSDSADDGSCWCQCLEWWLSLSLPGNVAAVVTYGGIGDRCVSVTVGDGVGSCQ